MVLDLERQLQFYGAYHHNKVNVVIHVLCVPTLLFTAFIMTSNWAPISIPSLTNTALAPTYGLVTSILYSFLYILMEPVAGATLAPFLISGAAFSNHLLLTHNATTVTTTAAVVHVLSWLAQFVGHGAFEHRAPALLDNLVQAVFLAPFFVWFEILFWFGYRPELQARLNSAVEKELTKVRAAKKAKSQADGSRPPTIKVTGH